MADTSDPNVFTQTTIRKVDARTARLSIQQSLRQDGTWIMAPMLSLEVSTVAEDGTLINVSNSLTVVDTDAFLTPEESAAAQTLFARIIGAGIMQAGFSQ